MNCSIIVFMLVCINVYTNNLDNTEKQQNQDSIVISKVKLFEKTEYNKIGYITTPTEWVKIDKAD